MGSTVVGDGDFSDVVDDHLIQALWAERGADDVGH
jgi:hypothetical protein